MNCPRCNVALNKSTLKDVKLSLEVDECNTCGGVWFDKGELTQIDKIIEPVFLEIRKIPKEKEQLKALTCPSCGNGVRLEKAEHPKDNKVVMDYCVSCNGIWLDKGELEAIQKENWLITMGRVFKWIVGN